MKSKKGKNLGFLATFVCLSLILAGTSPSVLCESLQERDRFDSNFLDYFPDLCSFGNEEEFDTDYREGKDSNVLTIIKSLLIQDNLSDTEKLTGILNSISLESISKIHNKISLAKTKLTLSAFDSDKEIYDNFITESYRDVFPAIILRIHDRNLVKLALSIQNAIKTQVHRIGKDEIRRILVVHRFPRASI